MTNFFRILHRFLDKKYSRTGVSVARKCFSHKPQKGFTLVEILVSLAVFVILMGVITAGLLQLFQQQRVIQQQRKSTEALSSFVTLLADELREKTIDFQYYGDFSEAVTHDLVLIDKEQLHRTHIQFVPEKDGQPSRLGLVRHSKVASFAEGNSALSLTWTADPGFAGLDDFQNLLPEGVSFPQLTFIFAPFGNPGTHLEIDSFQIQPSVTLLVDLGGDHLIQTSLSSRVL